MPTVVYSVGVVQSYTCNSSAYTVDVETANGWHFDVRNDDDESWIPVGTGTLTARYNYEPENWAFATNTTAVRYTPGVQWIWNTNSTTGTGYELAAWAGWQQTYNQVRVTQQQSALTQALAHADSMGRQELDLDLAEFLERIDAPDLGDEAVEQVMGRYDVAFAYAVNDRLDRLAEHRRQAEADRRAERLLVSLLSAEQKREWLEHKHVTERAPSGRRWRFYPIWSGGSTILNGESNVRRATLCVHYQEKIPNTDLMAGMLLALRNGDEHLVLAKANLHSGNFTPEEHTIRRLTREAIFQGATRDAMRRIGEQFREMADNVGRGLRLANDAAGNLVIADEAPDPIFVDDVEIAG